MKKIIIGLSGGVDSAVAAYLLIQQGYNVEALYMKNWDSFINNENYINKKDHCDDSYEYQDALKIAKHLNIKLHFVNFVQSYWENVFLDFINDHKKGFTPNPDILCNKYIKFDAFLNYAFEHFNCDKIAMGHYANINEIDGIFYLQKAKDQNKDQTYFLCELNQKQLSKTFFPLGNLLKKEVREIAKNAKIPVWDKKDSTGICFIGERNIQEFLKNYIQLAPGKVINIVTKKIVGVHQGIMFFTIGQNHGLGLGGNKCKYYVCAKDIEKHILYVCDQCHSDFYLSSKGIEIWNFNFIISNFNLDNLQMRFRHRQKLIDCQIEIIKKKVILKFNNPVKAVVIGQYGVIYDGLNCIGGGQINEILYCNKF